jgi:hypothetical protein
LQVYCRRNAFTNQFAPQSPHRWMLPQLPQGAFLNFPNCPHAKAH